MSYWYSCIALDRWILIMRVIIWEMRDFCGSKWGYWVALWWDGKLLANIKKVHARGMASPPPHSIVFKRFERKKYMYFATDFPCWWTFLLQRQDPRDGPRIELSWREVQYMRLFLYAGLLLFPFLCSTTLRAIEQKKINHTSNLRFITEEIMHWEHKEYTYI